MQFTPATADQVLAIRVNAGIEELATHPRFAAASADMVEAIVEGIGQFAAGEFAPLNRKGDSEGAQFLICVSCFSLFCFWRRWRPMLPTCWL